jgi:hypothetical protein
VETHKGPFITSPADIVRQQVYSDLIQAGSDARELFGQIGGDVERLRSRSLKWRSVDINYPRPVSVAGERAPSFAGSALLRQWVG